MYSENSRNAAVRRANDEFLRKLISGELQNDTSHQHSEQRATGCGATRNNFAPNVRSGEGSYCNLPQRKGCGCGALRGTAQQNTPSCNENDSAYTDGCMDCPAHVHAPALAMVYSPKQCWQNLLDPNRALVEGTLFADLVLPLDQSKNTNESEGCGRKCAR